MSITFQRLATRIIDDVIEDEKRHVDSDVITEQRRSVRSDDGPPLTQRESRQLVDAHNECRRRVGATDMELMVGTAQNIENIVSRHWPSGM